MTQIAKKENAVGQVLDFSQDAGAGLEGADKASFAIPFLSILQALSPQCESVEGAKQGLFINTITNELFTEVLVVPCAFQRQFLRWAPRDAGGGYKGAYSPIDVELNKVEGLKQVDGRYMVEEDSLSDTRNHFVLAQSKSGAWFPALISMASSQVKKSKRWMSLIQGVEVKDANGRAFNPASFSHVYKLTSVKEENSKGKWHSIEVELVAPVADAELYAKARKFHQDVAAGSVETSAPDAELASKDDRF